MMFRGPGGQQQDLFKQLGHASRMALRTTPLDKLSVAVDFEIFRDKLDELREATERFLIQCAAF